jgi:hypothetical protein
VSWPYFLVLLAAAYGDVGQPHEGLQVLAEARALMEQTWAPWRQAELSCLQDELLLRCGSRRPGDMRRDR